MRRHLMPNGSIVPTKFADDMIELFEDFEQGGFFLKGSDTEKLITSPKPSYDGAVPSGNSIAAEAAAAFGTN